MNYEDAFGWGGPNHMMTDIYTNNIDKERELADWEDKTNIVSFLMASSDDVRDYYGDDRFKDFTDEEIYENLRYAARKIDFSDDYDMIINWVKSAVITVPRTNDLLEDNADA